MVLHLTESTAFTSKAGYELERTQTTTEGGPLAALPLVSLYLYIPDCPPCVQMFQLKVVDLATWRAHGPHLGSFTPQPEIKTWGHSSQIDESSQSVVDPGGEGGTDAYS